MEEDYIVDPLPENLTMSQIKMQKEKRTKKANVMSCLFDSVSQTILTWIMTLKSPKESWDYLKGEYEENKRIRGMKVLNLIREFELKRIKEF